jgi:Tol biopolymer transport system component
MAQQKRPQDIDLQAAIRKESIDGDLKTAIKMYQKIADRYKADRAAAAQALLHMAGCYEKSGDAQARKVFEEVIHDYPDQKDAVAAARAKLGADQSVDVLDGAWSAPSPDGRYIVRAAGVDQGFVVRDLSTNTERSVPLQGVTRRQMLTPDGKRILYYWRKQVNPVNVPAELRIVNVDGTGLRTLIPAHDYTDLEAAAVTPDGKVAAVSLEHSDGNSWDLALLILETGKLQVLKTFRDVFAGNFSSDGHWLVYASRPDAPDSKDFGIYTIATDASATVNSLASSANSSKPFFAPDGSRVGYLVVGEAQDHVDLWSVRTANGKRAGEPELVRARVVDGSAFYPKNTQPGAYGMGIDRNGSYWLWSSGQTSALYVSGIESGTGQPIGTPQRLSDPTRRPVVTQPRWSPDGTSLAYLSNLAEAIIVIRNMTTGEEREIRTGVTAMDLIGWQPDGMSLEVNGLITGHMLINVDTGRRTPASGTVPTASRNVGQREPRPGGGQVAYVTMEPRRTQMLIFRGLFGK